MKEARIAEYIDKVEKAIKKANNAANNEFYRVLVEETEKIVQSLAEDIYQNEGINYPTPNEVWASARAMLWVAWTEWMWTCKAERDQRGEKEDLHAKKIKPIFEAILKQASKTGQKIGIRGRRPEEFLKQQELQTDVGNKNQ